VSALLDEVEAENGKVAVVARRHGISESLALGMEGGRLCGERVGAGGLSAPSSTPALVPYRSLDDHLLSHAEHFWKPDAQPASAELRSFAGGEPGACNVHSTPHLPPVPDAVDWGNHAQWAVPPLVARGEPDRRGKPWTWGPTERNSEARDYVRPGGCLASATDLACGRTARTGDVYLRLPLTSRLDGQIQE
jgi:hypothetical protein